MAVEGVGGSQSAQAAEEIRAQRRAESQEKAEQARAQRAAEQQAQERRASEGDGNVDVTA